MESELKLDILLISDIHLNAKNIQRLHDWHVLNMHGEKFDYVFASGDLMNL